MTDTAADHKILRDTYASRRDLNKVETVRVANALGESV